MNQEEMSCLDEMKQQQVDFIHYFDHVESKMIEWQQQIEHEIARLEEALQGQNIERQVRDILQALQQSQIEEQQSLTHLKRDVIKTTRVSLEHIQKHSEKMVDFLDKRLKNYDPSQFQRIASESCDHVERVAQDAVHKSNRLLKFFTWRIGFVAITASLLTTIIMGLYVSDEWPWETHRQAMSERGAGRMLLQAWPHLSHQQKLDILKHEPVSHG